MPRSAPVRILVVVLGLLGGPALLACSDDRDGDPAAFCAAATDAQRFDDLFDDLDPTNVDAARAAFTAAGEAEQELRADAPNVVRADIDILIDFFRDLVEGLDAADRTKVDRPTIYDELRPRFDQVEASSDRIQLYVETNC